MSTIYDPSALLRWALRANGAFSTLSALVFILATRPVAEFYGFPGPALFLATGIFLAFFAAAAFHTASQKNIAAWKVWTIVVLDVLWVIQSAAQLLAPPAELTAGGKWAVLLIALAVADFAFFQTWGWFRLRRTVSA